MSNINKAMNNPFNEIDLRLKKIEKLLQVISFNNIDPLQNQKELLTKKETLKLLKISQSTLWRWTVKNKLSSYGIENRVYYKKSEIIAALRKIN